MKEIQEIRMKRYFIDACKSIICGEGVHSLSSRNIAEAAGFSYATLYNYFKDMKDLLTICVEEFIQEAAEFIKNKKIKTQGKRAIIDKAIAFTMYFVQYPGIYAVVFTENIRELRSQTTFKETLDSLFSELLAEDWENENIKDFSLKEELIKHTIYSSLLLYLNRYSPKNYKDFMNTLNQQLNYILEINTQININ